MIAIICNTMKICAHLIIYYEHILYFIHCIYSYTDMQQIKIPGLLLGLNLGYYSS